MHNLKTFKPHSLKAHLDRMEDTAQALADLCAGEALALRLEPSQQLGRLCYSLKTIRQSIEDLAVRVRGSETPEP